jgi:outer membrane protein assembly factor BamB
MVLVGTSRHYVHVVDRQDGTLLSSYPLEDIQEGYEHCNSVVYKDGHIFFVASETHGQGSIKLHLSPDGKQLSEVWRNSRAINVFGGFIVADDVLYTTLENRKLIGIDTRTGRIKHSVRSVSGSIVYADNKLFLYGHNGRVQLFLLEDGKPKLSSEMRIQHGSGHHFSFPVIANGVMYIRRGDALLAWSIH